MEATTTIRKMLKDGHIFVPEYQRAYSWDTELGGGKAMHVNVFLSDLEQYVSLPPGAYYFGHFLFERTTGKTADGEESFAIVDGQQRLTTITIFLAALFAQLRNIRQLSEKEAHLEEDLVRRGHVMRFETVEHDRLFFKDFVIDATRRSCENLEYVSQRRIANAVNHMRAYLSGKTESELLGLLETVANAKCTTDIVENSGEAMQMFLFQNNRGKKPSKLEVVKALLMRAVYLQGGNDRHALLREMDARFSEMYRDLSAIENHVDEDEVLACACRMLDGSLYAEVSLQDIEKELINDGVIWAQSFAGVLSKCFRNLRIFFVEDSEKHLEAHALRQLGCSGLALAFIAKTYDLGIGFDGRARVWHVLESLILRHRLVGTRAILDSRLNDVFQNMREDNAVAQLEERLQRLATAKDWWWGYWTDERLLECLSREIVDRPIAKFLLWRYENELVTNSGENGYAWKRYSEIVSPELEHIAPQTPTDGHPVANGYGDYDDANDPENGIVSGHWLDSIGNHLILPKSHNCKIGNIPFANKHETYTHSAQQLEVREMSRIRQAVVGRLVWDKTCIERRRNKIVEVLMKVYSINK